MDPRPRDVHPRSRRLRVSLLERSDLGRRWRHQRRRQLRQHVQPGVSADGELRLTSVLCRYMKPAIALLALFTLACAGSAADQSAAPTGPGPVGASCAVARPDFGGAATAVD